VGFELLFDLIIFLLLVFFFLAKTKLGAHDEEDISLNRYVHHTTRDN